MASVDMKPSAVRARAIVGAPCPPAIKRWRCAVCGATGDWMVSFDKINDSIRIGNICSDCIAVASSMYETHKAIGE